jgi:hypothetical protein
MAPISTDVTPISLSCAAPLDKKSAVGRGRVERVLGSELRSIRKTLQTVHATNGRCRTAGVRTAVVCNK